MKKIIITLIVVAVVAAGFFMRSNGGDQPQATPVDITEVKRAEIIQKVNATGKIQPKTQINISADVSAKITNLYVKEGEWVEKGQILVEIDSEKFLASVESQEANVRSAMANAQLVKANLEQSKRVLDRANELFAKNLESQSSLDSAQAVYNVELARYESSLEQVEQVKGLLKRAKDDLSKTTMYAPMAGTISKLNKELGEIAIGSQFQEDVIMTIANLNEMEALVNVDENDIIAIKLGQTAEIAIDALLDVTVEGVVTEIATSATEQQTGTANQKTEFEVTIAVTTKNDSLRPGMTASADITTDMRDDALSVPIQSVTVRTVAQLTDNEEFKETKYTAGKDGFVEVVFVEKNGKVVANQVKTGIQSDDLIEILEGVGQGEMVVSGSYRAISRDLTNGESVSSKGADFSQGTD